MIFAWCIIILKNIQVQLKRKNKNKYVVGTLKYLSHIVLQNKYTHFNIYLYINFKMISAHACTFLISVSQCIFDLYIVLSSKQPLAQLII